MFDFFQKKFDLNTRVAGLTDEQQKRLFTIIKLMEYENRLKRDTFANSEAGLLDEAEEIMRLYLTLINKQRNPNK